MAAEMNMVVDEKEEEGERAKNWSADFPAFKQVDHFSLMG
jgi:hypothetical protein